MFYLIRVGLMIAFMFLTFSSTPLAFTIDDVDLTKPFPLSFLNIQYRTKLMIHG